MASFSAAARRRAPTSPMYLRVMSKTAVPKQITNAHHLVNRSSSDVLCLEIGDRTPDDSVVYPDDDLQLDLVEGAWRVSRKDDSSY